MVQLETAERASRPSISLTNILAPARRWWPLGIVLACYAIAALIVPTMTSAPVSDDWVYARSVEILVQQHHLKILDLTVVTLIFQVAWGALFAKIFGLGFGALRLSTVTLMFLSGIALYGLCRELTISRSRSALGTAAYLFSPLCFVLGFSFMSDPQFAALLVISTCFYVRGLRRGRPGEINTPVGSAVAACAFLVRQQGALIPLAVVLYLIVSRRLWLNRVSIAPFLRVVAIPASTTVIYYIWLKFIHGIPVQQDSFVKSVQAAGINGTTLLLERMTLIEGVYIGFFVLPIAAAAIFAVPRLFDFHSPFGWPVFLIAAAYILVGLSIFGGEGQRMPYVSQFVGAAGLGPGDLRGGRTWIVTPNFRYWFTAVSAVAALIVILALCRKIGSPATPDRAAAGMVVMIGFWQVVGVMPPSYHFRNWTISVDRYLLPLLPFALCLALWALKEVWLAQPIGWAMVAVLAVFSVAATRDFLVFQQATWNFAREANGMGIANTKLDAGSSWDGYHLWEYSNDRHIRPQTPHGPWWTNLFAPATDSTYVIASKPQRGYTVIKEYPYSSWLNDGPNILYLQRRDGAPGPP